MRIVYMFILSIVNWYLSPPTDYDHLKDLDVKMKWHISHGVSPKCNELQCFLIEFSNLKTNVEYSESENELLFTLFENFPKQMIVAISKLDRQRQESIYKELSMPIHDGIDIRAVCSQLMLCKFKQSRQLYVVKRIESILLPLM